MSEHLLKMAGALVRIRDGKIVVLTDPRVRCCPLRRDIYGVRTEDRGTVTRVLEQHMQELGMYGPERMLELQERTVSFGASEILADALNDGLVDATVIVSDGAGTVEIDFPAGHSEVLILADRSADPGSDPPAVGFSGRTGCSLGRAARLSL